MFRVFPFAADGLECFEGTYCLRMESLREEVDDLVKGGQGFELGGGMCFL
jgi:hypothetical protein